MELRYYKAILTSIFFFCVLMACEKETGETDSIDQTGKTDNLPDVSSYPIVSTNQSSYYNNSSQISAPVSGEAFYGQDAQYSSISPSYVDNGDGTVTDMVTGLMWEKAQNYMEWADAETNAENATTGNYNDWRVPTIKELYSLVDFSGNQGSGDPESTSAPADAVPFIDTDYFDFEYPADGGRYISVQFISQTTYGGVAWNDPNTFFGLNLADGRIKAYPKNEDNTNKEYECRFVRGNTNYGTNEFIDNGNGTITDKATGLMWSKYDSGDEIFNGSLAGLIKSDGSMNWEEALSFSETISFAGYDDWRLPDAKELHSIVDYDRSPDATNSAAIDPVFEISGITNEANQADYPAFWSSTTFNPGMDAVIIFFGRALGYIDNNFTDVHGAGCQRTDPKSGEPSYGKGPQGDVRRVYNYVRLVRDHE